MSSGLRISGKKQRHHFHYLWWAVGFLGIASLAVIGWYGFQWYTKGIQPPIPIPIAKADSRVDESDVSEDEVESHNVLKNNPKYISIPKLDVMKTRIYSVGVDSHNFLEMPTNIHDAGWYKKSVIPGTGYGAVLIDGHSSGNRTKGVFAHLSRLKEGDKITVERGDGEEFNYRVVESQTMSLEKVASSGMKMMMESADSEKEGLNIMTNAGTWIPRINQFDERVMLRAVATE